MATKRKFVLEDEIEPDRLVPSKKHTLDSDEEDSDDYEKEDLHDSDIEGGEEGVEKMQDEIKITPFNMREELEEGHFDTDGHYHFDKDAQVKDNWLDNIDWIKIKKDKNNLNPEDSKEDSNDSAAVAYNETQAYKSALEMMQPTETVQKTLQRLGKSRVKMSSVERLRRKKLGITDEAGENVTKFTEIINEILTRSGNMDIYQESYDQIKAKVGNLPTTSKMAQANQAASFDMYADDFDEKEQQRIAVSKAEAGRPTQPEKPALRWEFKWKQEDKELQGPYTTEQMLKWSQEKYFKEGVYVRKVGESSSFYTSNRIDFDLYL